MNTTFHRHWRDVPEGTWRWPNFSPAEIACRGTGKLLISEAALDKLQSLRDRLGKPLIVRSAYRSPEHNRAVGGATRSKHLDGAAFDIAMANHDPAVFEAAAREVGFLGFGFYPRSGFMHVDLGPARQWGERFPIRAAAFAAEMPHAREVLADSRTMKGGGAAGVATLGAAGVEVAQSVLAETQSAILPLVPYLDGHAASCLLTGLLQKDCEHVAKGPAWKQLVPVDQPHERHGLFAQGMDDMVVIDHVPMASAARCPTARQRHQGAAPEKQLQPVIVEPNPQLMSDQPGWYGVEHLAQGETTGGGDAQYDLLVIRRAPGG